MRIAYIGQLWEGATGRERMHALSRLGASPIPFDTSIHLNVGNRIQRSITARLLSGTAIQNLNRALQRFAKDTAFDSVWIDKGVWLYPETLALLRNAASKRLAVHYTPDAQLLDNKSRHFDACIPQYDLLVTTKSFELDLYKARGARELLLVLQGYGHQFTPAESSWEPNPQLKSNVCFIGHCQPHYVRRIKAASVATDGLRVWGPRWPRYAMFNAWARPLAQGPGLWGDQYPIALRSAKIALGLLSKLIPETTTTRTFEIPATATFMLAERTPEHLSLFEEGIEAEFFGSDDELRDKIRFYVTNTKARVQIAAAGHQRCLKSDYSDTRQLSIVLDSMSALGGNA